MSAATSAEWAANPGFGAFPFAFLPLEDGSRMRVDRWQKAFAPSGLTCQKSTNDIGTSIRSARAFQSKGPLPARLWISFRPGALFLGLKDAGTLPSSLISDETGMAVSC